MEMACGLASKHSCRVEAAKGVRGRGAHMEQAAHFGTCLHREACMVAHLVGRTRTHARTHTHRGIHMLRGVCVRSSRSTLCAAAKWSGRWILCRDVASSLHDQQRTCPASCCRSCWCSASMRLSLASRKAASTCTRMHAYTGSLCVHAHAYTHKVMPLRSLGAHPPVHARTYTHTQARAHTSIRLKCSRGTHPLRT